LAPALVANSTSKRPGTAPRGCLLLSELRGGGPTRLTDLVEILGADKGWVSRAVQGLTERGMLRRSPHPSDGRANLIALTRRGAAHAARVDAALGALSDQAVEGLDRRQRLQARTALREIRERLAAMLADPEGVRRSCR
jgi:DNA-binding MarR family transcriptional regulator